MMFLKKATSWLFADPFQIGVLTLAMLTGFVIGQYKAHTTGKMYCKNDGSLYLVNVEMYVDHTYDYMAAAAFCDKKKL